MSSYHQGSVVGRSETRNSSRDDVSWYFPTEVVIKWQGWFLAICFNQEQIYTFSYKRCTKAWNLEKKNDKLKRSCFWFLNHGSVIWIIISSIQSYWLLCLSTTVWCKKFRHWNLARQIALVLLQNLSIVSKHQDKPFSNFLSSLVSFESMISDILMPPSISPRP